MGGGETVALTLASHLARNHDVTIFCTRPVNKKSLEAFFGIGLKNIHIEVFGKHITRLPTFNSLKNSMYVRKFLRMGLDSDLIIDTCSNGLFDKKLPCKTICYVHFPNYTRPKRGIKSILNHFLIKEDEMFNYDHIVCNSKFTQQHVRKLTKKNTCVIYPPVNIESTVLMNKRKPIIVSIGRYSPEKKFDVLIDA